MPLESYCSEINISVAGREWTLSRASNFDELWEQMVDDDLEDPEDHIPYWTELWPSSIALSHFLESRKNEISGKSCLDIGCGLGLTALVAESLGAKVLAMDIEEVALRHASQNAVKNKIFPAPSWTVMDWRRPAVQPHSMARIWGGDIMYERRFVAPVLSLFSHALAAEGKVWIAEPGRTVYDAFLSALQGSCWEGRRVYTSKVDALYAQVVPVTVAIWELERRK